jgi:hypothetical protein
MGEGEAGAGVAMLSDVVSSSDLCSGLDTSANFCCRKYKVLLRPLLRIHNEVRDE